jgi:hypothetical protein
MSFERGNTIERVPKGDGFFSAEVRQRYLSCWWRCSSRNFLRRIGCDVITPRRSIARWNRASLPAIDERAIHYNSGHICSRSGAGAPPPIRSFRRDIPENEEEQRDHHGGRHVIPSPDQTDEVSSTHSPHFSRQQVPRRHPGFAARQQE